MNITQFYHHKHKSSKAEHSIKSNFCKLTRDCIVLHAEITSKEGYFYIIQNGHIQHAVSFGFKTGFDFDVEQEC